MPKNFDSARPRRDYSASRPGTKKSSRRDERASWGDDRRNQRRWDDRPRRKNDHKNRSKGWGRDEWKRNDPDREYKRGRNHADRATGRRDDRSWDERDDRRSRGSQRSGYGRSGGSRSGNKSGQWRDDDRGYRGDRNKNYSSRGRDDYRSNRDDRRSSWDDRRSNRDDWRDDRRDRSSRNRRDDWRDRRSDDRRSDNRRSDNRGSEYSQDSKRRWYDIDDESRGSDSCSYRGGNRRDDRGGSRNYDRDNRHDRGGKREYSSTKHSDGYSAQESRKAAEDWVTSRMGPVSHDKPEWERELDAQTADQTPVDTPSELDITELNAPETAPADSDADELTTPDALDGDAHLSKPSQAGEPSLADESAPDQQDHDDHAGDESADQARDDDSIEQSSSSTAYRYGAIASPESRLRDKAERARKQRRPRFSDLGVPEELVAELTSQGIESAFPIQQAAIPDALAGRDVLGRGQTGSGKTLAFGLPTVTRLGAAEHKGPKPRALLMAPTRELAMQVHDVIRPLANAMGLFTVLVAGGMSYTPQLRDLRRGVDIVVATPGRLIDLMEQEAADLSEVEVVVLDEADEMADMGFMPEVTRILDAIPPEAQHLLFSATLDNQVDELVKRYLREPVVHGVDSAQASVTTMRHQFWAMNAREKRDVIAQAVNRPGRTIVFVRTQRDADEVAQGLRSQGVMAGALHGGLPQGLRARVLHSFRQGRVPVLVATDVAARGIDVDDVSLVIQADPPHDGKDYLHRAGRTARAGEEGLVASIVLPRQRRKMSRIAHEAGIKERPRPVRPGERLTELTGGVAPQGEPITDEQYRVVITPPRPARKPGYRGKKGGYRGRKPPYRGRRDRY